MPHLSTSTGKLQMTIFRLTSSGRWRLQKEMPLVFGFPPHR
jgi:hypothetical protein